MTDHSEEDLRTVSEGQAYAMFFALVGNDRPAFDRLLAWTVNNLAQGDMRKNLPAWHWGQKDGTWGVIDPNSASDADLFMAYALLEAQRLWCEPSYGEQAQALGNLILEQETLQVEGLGLSLLPGRTGFVQENGAVKLNPSYVPPFLMARLARAWPEDARWAQLYLGSQALLLRSAKGGFYPDWAIVQNGQIGPEETDPHGDYDAIRVYLWLAMGPTDDPIYPAFLAKLRPVTDLLRQRGNMPERIDMNTLEASTQPGPAGFQVALAPLMRLAGEKPLAEKLTSRALQTNDAVQWRDFGYYNGALSLFAQGYMKGFYSVSQQGELKPRWHKGGACRG